jgi:hypothetical protein
MPRSCTVCTHKNRAEINSALLANEPYRSVAKRYGTSDSAMFRHKAEHLPLSLLKAQEVGEIAAGDRLAAELTDLKADVHRLKGKAEEAGDIRTALVAVDRALKAMELQAKLSQLINEGTTINIVQDPTFVQFNTLVVDALQPFPEARRAVLTALRGVGDA